MKHSVANRLLNLFVGDDLPNGVSVRVKAHVEQCDACQSEVALLRGDQDALHAYGAGIEAEPLAPEMGERFWLDIRRELRTSGMVGEQATQRPAAAAWWTGATLWRGLAAAAVLVAGVMIYGPFGEAPSRACAHARNPPRRLGADRAFLAGARAATRVAAGGPRGPRILSATWARHRP
ncbi:MAG: anti-sigma factor [Planctomycetota bacterium]